MNDVSQPNPTNHPSGSKRHFLKIAGIILLVLLLLIIIIGFALGESVREVLNTLLFVFTVVIVIGGVFYFFWRMIKASVFKRKPTPSIETRKPKNYIPYVERKATLNSLPNVKKLWLILILYFILGSIYGIIRLALEFIQNGDLSQTQAALKGLPLTGLAIGGTLMALVFIVVQFIYISSIYRMERWVLTIMWLGLALILIPPYKISNLYTFLPSVAVLAIYSYIIKRVYGGKNPEANPKTP